MKPSTAIKLYQVISQTKSQLLITVFGYTSHCKHRPSCGQYAVQQIQDHGTIWGSLKALRRLATCW